MPDQNLAKPGFRTVMRGYDPSEVDRHLTELRAALNAQQQRAANLAHEVERARAELTAAHRARTDAEAAAAKPSFTAFGARVGQILSLAEDEANDLRVAGSRDADKLLANAESQAVVIRKDADRYADETRAAVKQEAARVLSEAKRTADQMIDEAHRQAMTRRRQGEAIYEQQRAKAAKAAADFEQTLSERRAAAEKEFRDRTVAAERSITEAQERAAKVQAENDAAAADAARRTAALTAESEQKAGQIVADAIARADRIRAESERELTAAMNRRDSINDQLSNVRQMLATLTGTAPAALGLADAQDATDADNDAPQGDAPEAAEEAAQGEPSGQAEAPATQQDQQQE